MRRDAARNRGRILEAGGELFAERGLAATLNDVAHRAGVGVGTVYRHFPDKAKLIETLFAEHVGEMVRIGETGLADPDPWAGFVGALSALLELQAANRGLRELVYDTPEDLVRTMRVRERMLPIAERLVARAQAAGAMRTDIVTSDLPLVQLMTGAVADAACDVEPELWRRCLALLLRGLAAHPEQIALPGPALAPEQIDRVMTASKPSR